MDWFINLNVIMQAFLAATFTFLITSLGSAIVFCFKKVNKNLSDILLGVSAGIMLAASYFSLLAPAIDQAINMAFLPYIIVPVGFLCGGLLLFLTDKIFSKLSNEAFRHFFASLLIFGMQVTKNRFASLILWMFWGVHPAESITTYLMVL